MQLQESFMSAHTSDQASSNGLDQTCLVSFLVSTYNRASYVEACVRHLLAAHTPHSFEVIVRDNASPDNTRSVIEGISDPRLRYVRAPRNQGTISFLELGRLARGEIITWLSDEDDFDFQYLDYVIDTFRNDLSCSVLIGSVTVGPKSAEVIFPEKVATDLAEALTLTLRFSGCAGVFVRGELFKKHCDIQLTEQQAAYRAWNYYPIGFFA